MDQNSADMMLANFFNYTNDYAGYAIWDMQFAYQR
jgi:hypothetical protein